MHKKQRAGFGGIAHGRLLQRVNSITPVGHVMRLLEQLYTAAPEQPLHEVLQVMGMQGLNQVPVVQDQRLIGLLSRESIIGYLQVRQRLLEDERRDAA